MNKNIKRNTKIRKTNGYVHMYASGQQEEMILDMKSVSNLTAKEEQKL